MSFELERYFRNRPYLYHLTSASNIPLIRVSKMLRCAADLLVEGNMKEYLKRKRRGSLQVIVGGKVIDIRDQDPLHEGNIRFEDGVAFPDFVQYLNRHVFFWPGNDQGPIAYGIRHYLRYENDAPSIIRVPAQDAFVRNLSAGPFFSKYNSGSPRCTQGKGSPRSLQTFVSADEAQFGVAQVVEVTFVRAVTLPANSQFALKPSGPWKTLFNGQGG